MTLEEFDQILANAGLGLPQRRKLKNSLVRAQYDDTDNATTHLARASHVAQTLTAAGFNNDATDQIVRALSRAGHLHDDANVMHASAANLSPIQRQAMRNAERLGIPVCNGSINMVEMDRILANRPIDERMRVKTLFAKAGLID
jgi:hypothetical protein